MPGYFFFKLYIIVLVLPNIKMNPPQVYIWVFLFSVLLDREGYLFERTTTFETCPAV